MCWPDSLRSKWHNQPFENKQYLPLRFDSVYFLQFWNFKAKKLLHNLTFEIPVTQILLHRERFVSQGSCINFPPGVVIFSLKML